MILGRIWQVYEVRGKRKVAIYPPTTTEYESIGLAVAGVILRAHKSPECNALHVFRDHSRQAKWIVQCTDDSGSVEVKWTGEEEKFVSMDGQV